MGRVQVIRRFEGMKEMGVHLWQIFTVKEVYVKIYGRKHPSCVKYYKCFMQNAPLGTIIFDYNEIKEIEPCRTTS